MKKLTGIILVICMLLSVVSFASCSAPSGMNNSAMDSGGNFGGSGENGSLVGGSGESGSLDGGSGAPGYDSGEESPKPMLPNKGESISPDYSDGVTGDMGGDYDMPEDSGDMDDGMEPGEGGEGETTTPEQVVLPSGMMTAGAWNDNDYYKAWLDLFIQGEAENGKFYNYTNPDYSWGFDSLSRVKVSVTNGDNAVSGATVTAFDAQSNELFTAVTDAAGNAYLFVDEAEGYVSVNNGESTASANFSAENRELSISLDSNDEKLNVIEIMLVVDVTGSMGDEIYFLKAELADVINRIAANDSETVIKLAMLFYRDNEDKVPFDYYDFTNVTNPDGLAKQQAALNNQGAKGGGDYPEAVDQALEMAVNKQWSTGNTTKIIFHVLDAPAHEGDEYANRLVNATKTAAEKGIRICPILCSGAAEATEYTMREAAIYTGGTFIFVTDDSGIGGSHHDPGLPNATIELLNSLMVRLVKGYHTGTFDEPIYWKQDPNLNNQ